MSIFQIKKIADCPHWSNKAAQWFSQKWGIPEEAYLASMAESLTATDPVPQWYLLLAKNKLIGGAGVIENDFHKRPDLTPNLCALYVEEAYRKQGLAGRILDYICTDMQKKHCQTLYLLTDHSSFYERYGWEFFCMVPTAGGKMARMYIHRTG